MAQKLTLEWTQLENGARALILNADTWAAFERVAQSEGKTAQHFISTAVAGSLGTTMMDNYKLNPGSTTTTPIFSGSGDLAMFPLWANRVTITLAACSTALHGRLHPTATSYPPIS